MRLGTVVFLLLLAGAVALGGGVLLERHILTASGGGSEDAGKEILYWVAPMDPNFRRDGPGKSPMGMDLVPVHAGEEPGGDPSEVKLDPKEINAIGVRTAVARIEPITRPIETVGFVGYNEHHTSHVHLRVEGWIEKLHVRAVGEKVAKGDPLFQVYAPEISIASADLVRSIAQGQGRAADRSRRQLRNLGMSEGQIRAMARSGKTTPTVTYNAPQDGVVIAMDAAEGKYLEPDTRAISLGDLSSVWMIVDVFERDIGRVTSDMTAEARFEHLPGRVFTGAVDYVYPALDDKTRTLPVRLKFDNADRILRPNMYGTVALIPASAREAVTVPSEAVIRTGRAERVVLKTGPGSFKPRLVTTGLRTGSAVSGRTEIVQGLRAGEEVVASAQFLIDSESAMRAGFLRMAPTRADPAAGTGTLVSLDLDRGRAVVRHAELPSLDWPAMETRFGLHTSLTPRPLKAGDSVEFSAIRGADGLLTLVSLKPDDGIDAIGTGTVHGVTADGKLDLSHKPIPELGWPAMRMDLPVQGFDPNTVPTDVPVELALAKGDGGMFLVVGVKPMDGSGKHDHGEGQTKSMAMADGKMAPAAKSAPPPSADVMRAEGTIDSVDATKRTATITHGPLKEIGMPGMTMDFPIGPGIAADGLPVGEKITILVEKGADFSLTLVGVEGQGQGKEGRVQ